MLARGLCEAAQWLADFGALTRSGQKANISLDDVSFTKPPMRPILDLSCLTKASTSGMGSSLALMKVLNT
jgi:hypothetical protein